MRQGNASQLCQLRLRSTNTICQEVLSPILENPAAWKNWASVMLVLWRLNQEECVFGAFLCYSKSLCGERKEPFKQELVHMWGRKSARKAWGLRALAVNRKKARSPTRCVQKTSAWLRKQIISMCRTPAHRNVSKMFKYTSLWWRFKSR